MSNYIEEPARKIEVIHDADVIVAGGGPGGLSAALAAARHGAKVLLVERYGFLGGLATAGLVSPFLGHTASRSETPIVAGVLKELTEEMHRLGGAPSWEETLKKHSIPFDAESFKRAADICIERHGVKLMLHTMVVDVIKENGAVSALIVESKSGRQAVRAKMYIDATGDGDIAYKAGAEYTKGRVFDGNPESMGSFVHIDGVEHATEAQRKSAQQAIEKALQAGDLKFYNTGFSNSTDLPADHFSPNMTRWPGDSTNVADLTAAEVGVRRELWRFLELLRKQSGFESAYLRATSPQVGPRESRQIIGDYVLTGTDVQRGTKHDDAVARGSWWIDIHCPLGFTYPVHLCTVECPRREACPFWKSEHDKTMIARNDLYPPEGDWYDIPYRCLTPKGLDNLLVSGRCISATHEGMAGARVMSTCMAIGQAAGAAAWLCCKHGTKSRGIDVAELRSTLSADGALV
jgi:ribulose 1,5-bisphosphate synthetase/thiazole synthase